MTNDITRDNETMTNGTNDTDGRDALPYERFGRVGDELRADRTHGWPGVAGYVADADVFCWQCAEHMAIDTSATSDAAVLADTEWDGGATCGHCGIGLDVTALPVGESHD